MLQKCLKYHHFLHFHQHFEHCQPAKFLNCLLFWVIQHFKDLFYTTLPIKRWVEPACPIGLLYTCWNYGQENQNTNTQQLYYGVHWLYSRAVLPVGIHMWPRGSCLLTASPIAVAATGVFGLPLCSLFSFSCPEPVGGAVQCSGKGLDCSCCKHSKNSRVPTVSSVASKAARLHVWGSRDGAACYAYPGED